MSDLSDFHHAQRAWYQDRPPEERLLLLCLKTRSDERAPISASSLASSPAFDWSRFLQLAIRHGVAPLVQARLDAATRERMPGPIRAQLEKRNRAILFRNLQLTDELLQLDKAFAVEGIEAIWFKGPVLAQQLFSSVHLREFSDLDLLAPPDRIASATRLLRARGYAPTYDLVSPRRLRLHQRISNEHCFYNKGGGLCVDLHWALTEDAYSFSNESALKTRIIELAGHRLHTFGQEATLCYLCYHGSKHGWAVFRWISDVAEFFRSHPEIDWPSLMAGRLPIGTPRMLQLGVLLAVVALAAPVPAPVLRWALADEKVREIAREIASRSGLPDKLFAPSAYLGLMHAPRDRLRYWITTLARPTPLELEVVTLPEPLFFLYTFLRYFRLAKTYTLKAMHNLRRAALRKQLRAGQPT